MYLILALAGLGLGPTTTSLADSTIRLEDLRLGNLVEIKTPAVLLFFRPRCSGCKDQLQRLGCAAQEMKGIHFFAVGLDGKKEELLKETRGLVTPVFPALEGSPELGLLTGKIPVTPEVRVLREGKKLSQIPLQPSCEAWKSALDSLE